MNKHILTILFFVAFTANAQRPLSLDSVIAFSLRQHPTLLISEQEILQRKAESKGGFALTNPEVTFEAPYGQQFTMGVQQTFDNPLVYARQSALYRQNIAVSEQGAKISRLSVIRDAKLAYQELQHAEVSVKLWAKQDSIFHALAIAGEKRYREGDASLLEKLGTDAEWKQVNIKYNYSKLDLENARAKLNMITGLTEVDFSAIGTFEKLQEPATLRLFDTLSQAQSPAIKFYEQSSLLSEKNLKLQRARIAPGFMVGYINQVGPEQPTIYRFSFGLSIPVWFWTYSSQIKAAKYQFSISQNQVKLAKLNLNADYRQALNNLQKANLSINYYENEGLAISDTMINASEKLYVAGEISYITHLQTLSQAFQIKQAYYEALKEYNEAVLQFNFISGYEN